MVNLGLSTGSRRQILSPEVCGFKDRSTSSRKQGYECLCASQWDGVPSYLNTERNSVLLWLSPEAARAAATPLTASQKGPPSSCWLNGWLPLKGAFSQVPLCSAARCLLVQTQRGILYHLERMLLFLCYRRN